MAIPEERELERRGRRKSRLVAAAALVAAAGWLLHLSGADVVDRARSALETAASGSAPAPGRAQGAAAEGPGTGGDGPGVGAGGGGAAAAAADERLRGLRDGAAALEEAIRGFRERGEDFDRGRIGCPALAEGYGRVDRAMVDLGRAYVEARERVGSAGEALFRRAMAGADSAARLYDASGCERRF